MQQTVNSVMNCRLIDNDCNENFHKLKLCNDINVHPNHIYNGITSPVKSADCCVQCFQVQNEGCSQDSQACSMQYHLPVNNILLHQLPDLDQNVCTYTNHTNLLNQSEYEDTVLWIIEDEFSHGKHGPVKIGNTLVNSKGIDVTNL